MKKSFLLLVSMMLVLTLALSACSSSKKTTTTSTSKSSQTTTSSSTTASSSSTTASSAKATNQPQDGGTITYAYRDKFKGVFDWAWYGGNDDQQVLSLIAPNALFDVKKDLSLKPGLAQSYDYSSDHKTLTLHLRKDVKWADGQPVTAQDFKFAWYTIADKAYEKAGGARYSNVQMIQGVKDYHDGKAKTISGIKVLDDYDIQLTLSNPVPNLLYNLWGYPEPYHYLKDIPIAKMQDSPKIRQNPLGYGPFKITKIVPGQSVVLERSDSYYNGKPHLDKIIFKVVDPSLVPGLLKSGKVDLVAAPSSQYDQIKGYTNITLLKQLRNGYDYIGFHLGHWDAKKGINVMNDPKFQSVKFRQAVAYAIDREGIIKNFLHGLAEPINVPMSKVSWANIPADQVNSYKYDVNKAKQLLSDAGFKDTNGNGFVEDPQGKKFTVNFAYMKGTATSQAIAQYMVQNLRDAGIDAQLQGGKLIPFNQFYDNLEKDKKGVELFAGAWGLSDDPDPTGLWKSTDYWNFQRWVNKESDTLIDQGISQKAFDLNYRKDTYYKWEKLMNDQVPDVFTWDPYDVYAVNKRLHNVYSTPDAIVNDPQKWWVSSSK